MERVVYSQNFDESFNDPIFIALKNIIVSYDAKEDPMAEFNAEIASIIQNNLDDDDVAQGCGVSISYTERTFTILGHALILAIKEHKHAMVNILVDNCARFLHVVDHEDYQYSVIDYACELYSESISLEDNASLIKIIEKLSANPLINFSYLNLETYDILFEIAKTNANVNKFIIDNIKSLDIKRHEEENTGYAEDRRYFGGNCLTAAAKYGKIDILNECLAADISIDSDNNDSELAFCEALQQQNIYVIEWFLKRNIINMFANKTADDDAIIAYPLENTFSKILINLLDLEHPEADKKSEWLENKKDILNLLINKCKLFAGKNAEDKFSLIIRLLKKAKLDNDGSAKDMAVDCNYQFIADLLGIEESERKRLIDVPYIVSPAAYCPGFDGKTVSVAGVKREREYDSDDSYGSDDALVAPPTIKRPR